MEAIAKMRYIRISPRKVQIVLDLIRGKDAATAMAILKHTPKGGKREPYQAPQRCCCKCRAQL